MHGMMGEMNWVMWGGLLIWSVVLIALITAAVVLTQYVRSRRRK
jgi:hypothetical protein